MILDKSYPGDDEVLPWRLLYDGSLLYLFVGVGEHRLFVSLDFAEIAKDPDYLRKYVAGELESVEIGASQV
jgi:hypothetical protein